MTAQYAPKMQLLFVDSAQIAKDIFPLETILSQVAQCTKPLSLTAAASIWTIPPYRAHAVALLSDHQYAVWAAARAQIRPTKIHHHTTATQDNAGGTTRRTATGNVVIVR